MRTPLAPLRPDPSGPPLLCHALDSGCVLLPHHRHLRPGQRLHCRVSARLPRRLGRLAQPQHRPLVCAPSSAARRSHRRSAHLAAAHHLFRPRPRLLLALHQPGVLHLPRLPPAADADCRGAGAGRSHLLRPRRRGQILTPLDHLRPRRIHRPRRRGRRSPRLRPLDLAPPRCAPQRRQPARPSRRRRLHPLHVLALRPHRPQLRRAAPARIRSRSQPSPSARPSPGSRCCAPTTSTSPPPPPSPSPRLSSSLPRTLPWSASPPCSPRRTSPHRIQQLEATGQISRDNTLLLYGDQAYGSSIPFYLNRPLSRPALLVDGRSSSMLFGSTFPDAQSLFLTPAELLAQWGTGPRKLLFVPLERRDDVDRLLGSRQIILEETSGKALITDRPLDTIRRPCQTSSRPEVDVYSPPSSMRNYQRLNRPGPRSKRKPLPRRPPASLEPALGRPDRARMAHPAHRRPLHARPAGRRRLRLPRRSRARCCSAMTSLRPPSTASASSTSRH